jgi:hypothetical protein
MEKSTERIPLSRYVRATLAWATMLSYIAFTGVEVWYTHFVPQHFITAAVMIPTFYFTTRAVEGKKNGGGPDISA